MSLLASIPNPLGTSSITEVHDQMPSTSEILQTLTFQSGYNTNLVILGTTLLGLAAGIIGVFALLRKRSLMTDALSHATLPGIAIAFLTATTLGFNSKYIPTLLIGAGVTGIIGVLCIQAILRFSRLREDAAIGIVLSVFFGAGIVGLSYIQANAASGSAGLNKFIYGQAATMQPPDVLLMGGIALAAILATFLFLKEFALICFNDSFAKVDGWPVSMIDLVMMGLVVLVTVAGLQAVGLILVVAMLIIPAVAARLWTERLLQLVIIAGLIGAGSGYLGSVISALLPRKPAGAVIVLTCSGIFVLSMIAAPSRGIVSAVVRRVRLRLKIEADHIFEHAYESSSNLISNTELKDLSGFRGWTMAFRWMLIRSMLNAGQAVRTNVGLELTNAGTHRGAQVSRNHALWEQYLMSYADIAPSHVDWSVDQVEHVLSQELVNELERTLSSRGITIPQPNESSA